MGYNFLTDAELGKLIRIQAGLTDGQPEFMRLMNLYIEMEQDLKRKTSESDVTTIGGMSGPEWMRPHAYNIIKSEDDAAKVLIKAREFLHTSLHDSAFYDIGPSENLEGTLDESLEANSEEDSAETLKEESEKPLKEGTKLTVEGIRLQEANIKRLYAEGYSKRDIAKMLGTTLKELALVMDEMDWYITESKAGPDGKVARRKLNGMFTRYKGPLTKKEVVRIMKETGASEPCVKHYYNSARLDKRSVNAK